MNSKNALLLGSGLSSIFCSGMLVGGVCGIAGVVSGKDNVLDKFMSKKEAEYKLREEDLQDQYTPCTNEQQEEIDDVKDWLLHNLVDIGVALGNRCESDVTDNFDLTFDESLDITFKMLNQFDQIQIFCSTRNGDDDYDTLGHTIRFSDDERPGQINLHPLAFDGGECQIAGVIMHEFGHVVTGEKHEVWDGSGDWIHLSGIITEVKCESDH